MIVSLRYMANLYLIFLSKEVFNLLLFLPYTPSLPTPPKEMLVYASVHPYYNCSRLASWRCSHVILPPFNSVCRPPPNSLFKPMGNGALPLTQTFSAKEGQKVLSQSFIFCSGPGWVSWTWPSPASCSAAAQGRGWAEGGRGRGRSGAIPACACRKREQGEPQCLAR